MQWLAALCVRRPVFATVLVLAFVVIGVFGYMQLGVDRMPKVDFPTVIVTTVNPGASAEDIDREISDTIEEAGNARGLFVPSAAVRNLEGSTRVYLVTGDHVEERLVTVGQIVGDRTEIVNGLSEGQQVASASLDKLADGTRIRVKGGASPAPPPAR